MRRFSFGLAVMALVAMGISLGHAAKKATPGHSNAFGVTLAQAQKGFWTWLYESSNPVSYPDPAPDGVKRVQFLPLPTTFDKDGVGTVEITLEPGTPFMVPVFVFIGEGYGDGSEDPADVYGTFDVFTQTDKFGGTVDARAYVDGRLVLDNSPAGVTEFFTGPTYFDEPIVYDTPTFYGSVSAIWVSGLGFVHPPLPPGEHTLEIIDSDSTFGFTAHNIWHITVAK